jgi:RHS repeat-associated protein
MGRVTKQIVNAIGATPCAAGYVPSTVADQDVLTTFTYNALNRLTSATQSNSISHSYTYDPVGNQLTETACIGGACGTTGYTYDNANRLKFVNGLVYTWDNNGNPSASLRASLTNDSAITYTSDAANRLKTVTQGAYSYSYVYNGTGDRLQQTVNGATTTYTLDLAAGLTQVLGDGTYTYLYGHERILQNSTAKGKEYFLNDALGSMRQLSDSLAVVKRTQDYEPYGEVLLTSTGSGSTAYGFAGEWADTTGLIHLRARYYASGVGRFVSKDPWRGDYLAPQSLNGWSYANANPILYTDPSGKGVCFYGTDPVTGACRPAPWASILPPSLAHVAQPSISPQQTIGVMILAAVCYVGYRVLKDAMPQTQPQTQLQVNPIERLYTLPESDPEKQPTATPFGPVPIPSEPPKYKHITLGLSRVNGQPADINFTFQLR